jgi:glycosyltransferase involved in cell wall biosynthesis
MTDNINNDAIVTFIIPTIGRETLSKTLDSLINQTNSKWKAIIVFDGIPSNIENSDSRIRIIESQKLGEGHNSAGLVRNYGINFADTEWVAFVDDDDSLSHKYVETLINESSTFVLAEIIIFRMVQKDKTILPQLESKAFFESQVGISFAVKKKLFDEGCIFTPSSLEDFCYLNEAMNRHYKIMISPYIRYFVRDYNCQEYEDIGKRSFICKP